MMIQKMCGSTICLYFVIVSIFLTTTHGYLLCDSKNVRMTIDNKNYTVVLSKLKTESEVEFIIDANPEEDIQIKCEEIGNADDLNIKFCSDGNKEDNVCFDKTINSRANCSRNISPSDFRSSACG